MARTFEMKGWFHLANALMGRLVGMGITPNATTLLTVRGRKSGVPRTTVVSLIERDGQRFIIAPFGAVDWVRNLRAAGAATLRRGRRIEEVQVQELAPEEATPVLQQALGMAPKYVREHFDVTARSSLDDIAREAPRHPVFRLKAARELAIAS